MKEGKKKTNTKKRCSLYTDYPLAICTPPLYFHGQIRVVLQEAKVKYTPDFPECKFTVLTHLTLVPKPGTAWNIKPKLELNPRILTLLQKGGTTQQH